MKYYRACQLINLNDFTMTGRVVTIPVAYVICIVNFFFFSQSDNFDFPFPVKM